MSFRGTRTHWQPRASAQHIRLKDEGARMPHSHFAVKLSAHPIMSSTSRPDRPSALRRWMSCATILVRKSRRVSHFTFSLPLGRKKSNGVQHLLSSRLSKLSLAIARSVISPIRTPRFDKCTQQTHAAFFCCGAHLFPITDNFIAHNDGTILHKCSLIQGDKLL